MVSCRYHGSNHAKPRPMPPACWPANPYSQQDAHFFVHSRKSAQNLLHQSAVAGRNCSSHGLKATQALSVRGTKVQVLTSSRAFSTTKSRRERRDRRHRRLPSCAPWKAWARIKVNTELLLSQTQDKRVPLEGLQSVLGRGGLVHVESVPRATSRMFCGRWFGVPQPQPQAMHPRSEGRIQCDAASSCSTR